MKQKIRFASNTLSKINKLTVSGLKLEKRKNDLNVFPIKLYTGVKLCAIIIKTVIRQIVANS